MQIETSMKDKSRSRKGIFSKIMAVSPIGEKATVKEWEAIFLAIDKQIIGAGRCSTTG